MDPPRYRLSPDDAWCNSTRNRIALAIGQWLVESKVTHRAIHSLQLWEMEAIAEAATAEYIKACTERFIAEEEHPPEPTLLGI